MNSSRELFMRSREDYFGVYFPSCEPSRENNKNNTRMGAQTVGKIVHTLSYFLHDITNP